MLRDRHESNSKYLLYIDTAFAGQLLYQAALVDASGEIQFRAMIDHQTLYDKLVGQYGTNGRICLTLRRFYALFAEEGPSVARQAITNEKREIVQQQNHLQQV